MEACGSPASVSHVDVPDGFCCSGHPWIGRRVRRVFYYAGGRFMVVEGAVVAWAPAGENGDEALWRTQHEGGGVEDLSKAEAGAALRAYASVHMIYWKGQWQRHHDRQQPQIRRPRGS